ncbi:MAG: hypothetical protein HY820_16680 [Acidobacteria bacterium]|nr:hypothetical protein [Acidobacteriota bacterium]
MTLSERDRRALLLLGFAAIGTVLYVVISDTTVATGTPVSAQTSIPAAEKRLDRMRQMAALVPGREEVLKQVQAQVSQREKRILQADTAAQAQAQLLQIVRRVAQAQNPPVELRGSEFGAVKSLADFGEVPVSVNVECGVEQLLNILSELTAQQELLAVNELRVYSANAKQKTTNVRLMVTALVPKKLVPEKKGGAF